MHLWQDLIHTVVYEGTPLTFRSDIPTPGSIRGGGIGLLRLGLGGGAGLLFVRHQVWSLTQT